MKKAMRVYNKVYSDPNVSKRDVERAEKTLPLVKEVWEKKGKSVDEVVGSLIDKIPMIINDLNDNKITSLDLINICEQMKKYYSKEILSWHNEQVFETEKEEMREFIKWLKKEYTIKEQRLISGALINFLNGYWKQKIQELKGENK